MLQFMGPVITVRVKQGLLVKGHPDINWHECLGHGVEIGGVYTRDSSQVAIAIALVLPVKRDSCEHQNRNQQKDGIKFQSLPQVWFTHQQIHGHNPQIYEKNLGAGSEQQQADYPSQT